MRGITYGAVRLISHTRPPLTDRRIESVLVERLDSIDAYNRFMVYELAGYVETTHCLVVQADGFALNPDLWDPEFLDYDYIGSPWPRLETAYIDPFGNHQRVGNGGFSLRSRRLLRVPQHAHVEWEVNSSDFYKHMGAGLHSEDGCICVHNRHVYEAAGCRFAPLDVAARFASELPIPERLSSRTFGFHKYDPGTGRKRLASWSRGWPWLP
jgi:hypothetical protein